MLFSFVDFSLNVTLINKDCSFMQAIVIRFDRKLLCGDYKK